jgi:hypothetical protein
VHVLGRALADAPQIVVDRHSAYGAAGRLLRIRGRALPDGAGERHGVGDRHIEDALARGVKPRDGTRVRDVLSVAELRIGV